MWWHWERGGKKIYKYLFACLSTHLLVEKTFRSFSRSYFFSVLILHFLLPFIYPFRTIITFPYFTTKTVKDILRFVAPVLVTVTMLYSRLRCHAYSWAAVVPTVNWIIFSSLRGHSCEQRPVACVSTSILCVSTQTTWRWHRTHARTHSHSLIFSLLLNIYKLQIMTLLCPRRSVCLRDRLR